MAGMRVRRMMMRVIVRVAISVMTMMMVMAMVMIVVVVVIVMMVVVMAIAMIVVLVIMMIVVVVMPIIAIRADALHMMVMPGLGQPDFRLEADHLLAVLAHAAVHVVVAFKNLPHPVGKGIQHQRMVVQILRLQELDLRMRGRHLVGDAVDALHQHARE
jgi:hypothetical protein